ncbi:hypothetical protein VTK73DRAFT_1640 [Phialemonium thermophilum]|uniref:Uncharacterized protein n=1 Tax=Phialemonium thermophilum TaxID=223376 RepID=A0ABR3VT71_9PEZI
MRASYSLLRRRRASRRTTSRAAPMQEAAKAPRLRLCHWVEMKQVSMGASALAVALWDDDPMSMPPMSMAGDALDGYEDQCRNEELDGWAVVEGRLSEMVTPDFSTGNLGCIGVGHQGVSAPVHHAVACGGAAGPRKTCSKMLKRPTEALLRKTRHPRPTRGPNRNQQVAVEGVLGRAGPTIRTGLSYDAWCYGDQRR